MKIQESTEVKVLVSDKKLQKLADKLLKEKKAKLAAVVDDLWQMSKVRSDKSFEVGAMMSDLEVDFKEYKKFLPVVVKMKLIEVSNRCVC
jgi:hypothetical protein